MVIIKLKGQLKAPFKLMLHIPNNEPPGNGHIIFDNNSFGKILVEAKHLVCASSGVYLSLQRGLVP